MAFSSRRSRNLWLPSPSLASLTGPILSLPRRPRDTARWAVGDTCKGTGEAAGHHMRQRTYSAACQVLGWGGGGGGSPVFKGKIGGGRKKLQVPALISALQNYCSFSKPPKSSAALSSLNHPYTCFIYSELSKPNIFYLFSSHYLPGSLFANTELSIESWMSLSNSAYSDLEFTLWFNFIIFCWAWLLLNHLLCLLYLFPFFLFSFVIRGTTFFPQHDSILEAKICFCFCLFVFPPSTSF